MKDLLKEEIGKTLLPDDQINKYINCHTEDDQKRAFLYAIFKGESFRGACGIAELEVKEVKHWLAKGEDKSSQYHNFYVCYNKMLGLYEYNRLCVIEEGERNGAWSAALARLERTMPERYSTKQEVKVDNENLQIVLDV